MMWGFLVMVLGIFVVIFYTARRTRLTNKLARRSFFHDETYWAGQYREYDSLQLMAALTDLSELIGIPFTSIDPADKLAELTLAGALNSDLLDDIAFLLRDKYKIDEKALRQVWTVDDYIRAALHRGDA